MKKIIALFVAALASFVSAGAQTTIFSTNFDGADGTQPSGFTSVSGSLTISSNEYRLGGTGAVANSLSVYSGTGSSLLEDYTVSASFRIGAPTSGVYAGLVANYQNSSNFYQARMFSSGTTGTFTLQIYKTVAGSATKLAESASFSYTGAPTYTMSFAVVDGELTFSLFNTSGTLVSSISATDSSLTSGSAGVRATSSTSGAVVYETFGITSAAIPEPATSGILLGLSGIAVAIFIRRGARVNTVK